MSSFTDVSGSSTSLTDVAGSQTTITDTGGSSSSLTDTGGNSVTYDDSRYTYDDVLVLYDGQENNFGDNTGSSSTFTDL